MDAASRKPTQRPAGKPKSNRERFLDYAEKRTNQVLRKLRVLGHCSNRQLYEYTPADVQRVFRAIEDRLREVKSKFTGQSADGEFKLQ